MEIAIGRDDCSKSSSKMILWTLLWLGITCRASNGLQIELGSRREFVTSVATVAGITLLSPDSALASSNVAHNKQSKQDSVTSLSAKLLSIIPVMESGAPATDATLPREVSSQIEDFVATQMEGRQSNNAARSTSLTGSWKLLYSNAPEIVSLSKGLPLGFRLGPTYQPLDASKGFFENKATLDHPYQLATLQTIVVGTINPSSKGSLSASGVTNAQNNRVDVNFQMIAFQLDTLLGKWKLEPPIRKTIVPKPKSRDVARPCNDQVYLDDTVRIVRGGDGSLFVFQKANPINDALAVPLSVSERDNFLASSSAAQGSSSSQTPVAEDLERELQAKTSDREVPAEIKFLFR